MSEEKILIFSGTTEGRQLSEYLSRQGVTHLVSVATDYGHVVMEPSPCARVLTGRMDAAGMAKLIRQEGVTLIIDATHPYAQAVSGEIRLAAEETGTSCLRLLRESGRAFYEPGQKVLHFSNAEACAEALCALKGHILLTTGSKELAVFAGKAELKERLFARILPGFESLSLCEKAGLKGRQILALQGPFTEEMNLAMLRQYGIDILVTKETGSTGGFPEKVSACAKAGVTLAVIDPPKEEGLTGAEVRGILSEKLGIPAEDTADVKAESHQTEGLQIALIGCGLGYRDSLTSEALKAAKEAQIIFGAERLISIFPEKKTYPLYRFEDIMPVILRENMAKAAVLFSGDTGFFSGCPAFYQKACAYAEEKALAADIRIYPGISSVSALSARLGIGYDADPFYSLHGRNHDGASLKKLIQTVQRNERTYLILSGGSDLALVCGLLKENGLGSVRIRLGCQLGQADEAVIEERAETFPEVPEKKLYIACLENAEPDRSLPLPGWPEEAFLRDRVPMTKAEVRALSLEALKLDKDSVVYDIGSGSGSVSCEMAALWPDIRVYAIEKKPEAIALTRQNIAHFGLDNITVIEGEAPEALAALPAPTHAFIGGSGGNLREILSLLREKDPAMRVVVNAVTLETMGEIAEVLREFPIKDSDVRQVQIARGRKAGPYHLMQSENPVLIAAFTFDEQG